MRKSLYLKILVPIDGSKYSEKALVHACELAKIHQGSLTLIYVVNKSLPINFLDRSEYLQLLRGFGKRVLNRANRIALKKGLESKQVIKEGAIAKEIIKFARKENINIIVVGSHGLGATARLFLGSVSNKLANNSHCSVLIVK